MTSTVRPIELRMVDMANVTTVGSTSSVPPAVVGNSGSCGTGVSTSSSGSGSSVSPSTGTGSSASSSVNTKPTRNGAAVHHASGAGSSGPVPLSRLPYKNLPTTNSNSNSASTSVSPPVQSVNVKTTVGNKSNGHGPKKKLNTKPLGSNAKKSTAAASPYRSSIEDEDEIVSIIPSKNNHTDKVMMVKTGRKTSSSGIVSGQSSSSASSSIASTATMSSKRQLFLEIVRQSNLSCQNGDYAAAIKLYTQALKSDPNNHILYSNRSAALLKLGYFAKALQDANKARDLHPKWAKAYYRQGVALQCLGKHAEAIAAFSSGLAEDPKSGQLLSGLIEASVKSPLKAKLEPTLAQLSSMKLAKSPFVVISVVGQELLAEGHFTAAAVVLENALRIGSGNTKLNGSVLSALSSAHWALNSLDKAINYMQQDLAVAKSLGDVIGECRAHGNLGSAYFTKANYKDALTSHRYQLVLAMKCKDTQAATSALTSLGHVYTAIGDYANALASHKQCVQLVKQTGNVLLEAREIGNVGAVYLVMGDFSNAIDCHLEHLRLAKSLNNKVEEARAYSNLGSSYHYQRNFEQAIVFHNHVLQIAHELSDQSIEARAYAGLGHAARCMNDLEMAKLWHEKQLDMALTTKDKVCEGRACSNLGIIYQMHGDYDAALKLHQVHLTISTQLYDRAGLGRAFGNIGNAYNAMGYYEQAVKYYKKELGISKEVNDRSSEASTHGNLAIAYQALRMVDKALVHYHSHLNISRELKETASEACALLNLGNCHSSTGDYSAAIPLYENYLMLSQELHDISGEGKACHLLGYIHYSLGNYREAVRYYNQDLILAKDCNNSQNVGRAYCNLGLTYLALGQFSDAMECQTYFLNVAESLKCVQTTFRALSNIGNILIKMGKMEDAGKIFQKQIILTKEAGGSHKSLEAAAFGSLGMVNRILKKYDYALGFHTQELNLLNETNDLRGQCRAHGNLGSVHMSIGHYNAAIKCYEEMLIKAKQMQDKFIEAQAYGNLGIARMNIGNYEDAATYFEQQLFMLDSLLKKSSAVTPAAGSSSKPSSSSSNSSSSILTEQGAAYSNLGDCFTILGDHAESIRCFQKGIEIAINTRNIYNEEKCTRSIGLAYKALGNTEQMIHWLERRLAVALSITTGTNEGASTQTPSLQGKRSTGGGSGSGSASSIISSSSLNSENPEPSSTHGSASVHRSPVTMKNDLILKALAYQDLGMEYQALHNTEQAISCFQQQLGILTKSPLLVKEVKGKEMECVTLFNLGQSYYQIGNYTEALKYYESNLKVGTEIGSVENKLRGYRSIGLVYEALNNFEQSLIYQEKHLSLATHIDSTDEKLHAFCSIGRLHYALGNQIQARAYLQESLQLVDKVSRAVGSNQANARHRHQTLTVTKSGLREEEATIQYFLGLVLWKQTELESAEVHLQKATKLLETIQQDVIFRTKHAGSVKPHPSAAILAKHSTNNNSLSLYSASGASYNINYSLQLYDRQIASYQALQRILASLGKTDQTLLVAEKCRTIANSVLHHQQQALNQSSYHMHSALSPSHTSSAASNHSGSGSHLYYQVRSESSVTIAHDAGKDLYSLPYSGTTTSTTTTTTIPIQLINSVDALLARVNRHRTASLYYSISGGFLFAWLLIPDRGIVKFHEFCIDSEMRDEVGICNNETEDNSSGVPNESTSTISALFSYYIQRIRTALGIDYNSNGSKTGRNDGEVDEMDENEDPCGNSLWAMHMEELGDRLNHEHDRTGFLRMIIRNHRFNCSSYSLSSLFSVGSTTGSVKSIPNSSVSNPGAGGNNGGSGRSGSTRSCKMRSRNTNNNSNMNSIRSSASSMTNSWHGQSSSCIRSLYQILIAPFDEELNVLDKTCFRELYLVLESDLFLVPFSILRNSPSDPHFYERFKLMVVPSVSSIRNESSNVSSFDNSTESERDQGFGSYSLVVGAPLLPTNIAEQWNWCPLPRAENEASMIGELLHAVPLTGANASKTAILSKICTSEVIHFATHISWRLSGIVLSPTMYQHQHPEEDGLPPTMSDYLLTAADILKLRLCAKLVVLSSCHTRETQSILNSECITSVSRALLAAGVSCVLIPLWPVPEIASKIFFRSFYSALLQGSRVSTALSEAISTVQHTKHFAHPANWSGYLLIGSDIRLTNKSTFTNTAIWKLMQMLPSQERIVRDALRVTLHLVEKSLQRINNGQKTAMYTTQKSIENKIGSSINGWKDVLISVGFRFEPASNDLPAAVFFPQEDLGERLVKCSNSLQAVLGLSSQSLNALTKILQTPEIGSDIVAILRQAIAKLSSTDMDSDKVAIKVDVKLWGTAGCHELLASLGFDLIEVGENEVTLGIGSHVILRLLQITLEATLSLCEALNEMDTEERKKHSLKLERNISLESLEDLPSQSPTTAFWLRQQIGSIGSGGAFTSYVRNRGEPDGHTNISPEGIASNNGSSSASSSRASWLPPSSSTSSTAQYNSAGRSICGGPAPLSTGSGSASSNSRESLLNHALRILRADSCSSSESSIMDWEKGTGSSTVRRNIEEVNQPRNRLLKAQNKSLEMHHHEIPPHILGRNKEVNHFDTTNSISYENQYEVNKALKHVSWNATDGNQKAGPQVMRNSASAEDAKQSPSSWMKLRTTNVEINTTGVKDSSPTIATCIDTSKNVSRISTTTSGPTIQEHLKSTNLTQMNRELPISDVYNERNIGLDLAPSLSKLIMANQISLGQLLENDDNDEDYHNNKTDLDTGAISMDDTISTFDQLSLAEDSAPESSIDGRSGGGQKRIGRFPRIRAKSKAIPPVPMRRTLFDKNEKPEQRNSSHIHPHSHHHLSIDLQSKSRATQSEPKSNGPAVGNDSSGSSSKSSPSDLSKRDEGDGRSLTDSQYGSYSPSMALNTINSDGSGKQTPLSGIETQQTKKNSSAPSSVTISIGNFADQKSSEC